jgi:hypothetical protein
LSLASVFEYIGDAVGTPMPHLRPNDRKARHTEVLVQTPDRSWVDAVQTIQYYMFIAAEACIRSGSGLGVLTASCTLFGGQDGAFCHLPDERVLGWVRLLSKVNRT